MKLKTFLNRLGLGFFGIVALLMVIPMLGDFLPDANGMARKELEIKIAEAEQVFQYLSADLIEAEEELRLAKIATEEAELAEQTAANAVKTVQTTLCAQQLVLGQLKWKAVSSEDKQEMERLKTSIQNAQACLVLPVQDF